MRKLKIHSPDRIPEQPSHPEPEEQPSPEIKYPTETDIDIDQVMELIRPIADTEVEIRVLTKQQEQLQSQLDETVNELASLVTSKERIMRSLPGCLLRLCGLVTEDADEPPFDADEPTDKPVASVTQSESEPEPTDWRELLTQSICDGVPGLGKKKIVKLVDAYPTIGKLNDLRVEAAKKNCHFADALPKGFGKQTADELAARLMKLETDHGQPSAAEQAAETAREGATEPAESAGEPVERSKKRVDKKKPDPVADQRSKHERWCDTLARSLRVSAKEDDPGEVLASQEDAETHQDGIAAHDDGQPVNSCPIELTQDFAADWVRGWLWAEHQFNQKSDDEGVTEESGEEDSNEATSTDELDEPIKSFRDDPEDDSPPTDPASADDSPTSDQAGDDQSESGPIDDLTEADIERMIEEVKSYEDKEPRSAIEQWNLGFSAALAGSPPTDCPKTYFQHQAQDWLRGYFTGLDLEI